MGNQVASTGLLESPLASLLYYPGKDGLVGLTQGMQLAYWTLTPDLQLTQVMKVKVVSQGADGGASPQVMWVGPGLLATSNNEAVLRLWNLEKDENYLLHLTEQDDRDEARRGAERISCVSFNPRKRVLAGGTREGRIVFWQFVGGESSTSPEDWEAFAEIDLDTAIHEIQWGPGETLLSASMSESVSILHETILKRKMLNNTAVIQLSPECVFVENLTTKSTQTVKSGLRIKGLDLYGEHFCVWNGKLVEVYHIQDGGSSVPLLQSFEAPHPCAAAAMHSELLFIAQPRQIEAYTFQTLNKRQTIQLSEKDGAPEHLDIHGDFLVCATSTNNLRLWRLGKEARPSSMPTKQLFQGENMEITSVKCNCNGTKISLLCKVKDDAGHTMTDTKVYVYDVEADKLSNYDFGPVARNPISHAWDETEPRLLGCETRRFRSDQLDDDADRGSRIEVATLFVSSEKGVMLQDAFPLDRNVTALIGLAVPNLHFFARFLSTVNDGDRESHIEVKPMPNFEGINISDTSVKDALLSFSYYLTFGDMDQAYKAVKSIKDQNIWHNMALMCIKTKRLDVAEVCLGNMQNASAARALREAKEEPEVEAAVATLAIHLNQLDDAERLFTSCKRYDLLNKMYQACGKWDLALQTAEKHDRIHLRTIHYNRARFTEGQGDLDGATKGYEESKTNKYEVPRMLFDHSQMGQLEDYVQAKDDKDLYGWWAQYQESMQQFDTALRFYERAGDTLSMVRLYCHIGHMELAADLVNQQEHLAAAYHLARQFEANGDLKEAIKYFSMAKAFKHAVMLAREADMHQDILALALQANRKDVMLEAAAYFEEKGLMSQAVTLYHRGGHLSKTINLCVKGRLFDELTSVADNLDSDSTADPAVFMQCAEFFLSHGQHEKAVKMLINGKAFERALGVCVEQEVLMTDEMAEKMTLPKSGDEDAETYRMGLLKRVAKTAKLQQSWHLACKKYTQAGDKVKAMKALVRSGDKDKIIFFVSHSRVAEIYIMGGNFLQKLDWHQDPEIMKNIINFYTKARAVEQLAMFYDSCAKWRLMSSGTTKRHSARCRRPNASTRRAKRTTVNRRCKRSQRKSGLWSDL
eukprot:NODE_16_length_3996_cov_51.442233_g15_i0.p1 GENE.NODE_16_length_3996_cov_51.442233_g15_i0~~NODE_16_length_3996_cov_51.442233_g15_i0.p1  ORF type:complete len:1185 (-),score=344.87 NODE_16_length_3996_cov_51.442233_g15_i0:442-3720(-)